MLKILDTFSNDFVSNMTSYARDRGPISGPVKSARGTRPLLDLSPRCSTRGFSSRASSLSFRASGLSLRYLESLVSGLKSLVSGLESLVVLQ